MSKTFDPAKPVQTRSGKPARVLCTDRKNGECPIVALVTERDGSEECLTYNSDGSFYSAGHVHHLDLINVPERVTGWVNIYVTNGKNTVSGYTHGSKEAADETAQSMDALRIACVHVDYEKPE